MINTTCEECGEPMTAASYSQAFCCPACRDAYRGTTAPPRPPSRRPFLLTLEVFALLLAAYAVGGTLYYQVAASRSNRGEGK